MEGVLWPSSVWLWATERGPVQMVRAGDHGQWEQRREPWGLSVHLHMGRHARVHLGCACEYM